MSTGASAELLRAVPTTSGRVPESRGTREVILIADRFAPFADGEHVLTISDLMALVCPDAAAGPGRTWVVHLGQGIERSDWDLLDSINAAKGSSRVVLADSGSLLARPVPVPTVHKHRAENVLLADLRHVSKTRCSASLRIHRDNELVLDHCAVRHVSGMVIVEAMRQICIAQFETGYRCDLPPWTYAGIWQRINLSFTGFLFALPATVVSQITACDLSKESNLQFRATTSVWQDGSTVASADIEYSMIKQERFDVLERRKATSAAQAQLAGKGADDGRHAGS